MKPEPWGETLDGILAEHSERLGPLIIFPSPAGEVFTQSLARELAGESHLVFGCGRYEGIDQRVFDEYAERGRVRLVSMGDYVLNGGEVATLAMIEAIGRLLPGVVGNPESLVAVSYTHLDVYKRQELQLAPSRCPPPASVPESSRRICKTPDRNKDCFLLSRVG